MRKNYLKVNFRYCIVFLAVCTVLFGITSQRGSIRAQTNDSTDNTVQDIKETSQDLYQFLNDINESADSVTPVINPTNAPPSQTTSLIPPNTIPNFSTTDIAKYVDEVIRIVHLNCLSGGIKGVVTNQNRDCLNTLKGVMNEEGINEMKISATLYRYVQCVGCARAMPKARGKLYGGIGNAKQHAGQKVGGYDYYPTRGNEDKIVPGSLFVMTGGAYGHIGYVTEIYRDANGIPHSFKAFECNYQHNGYVSHEKIWTFSRITGFQVPKGA